MAKPTGTLPRWATSPSLPGDIVEPPSGTLDDGWNPSDRPPAQWLNWWQNKVGQWVTYLDSIHNASGEPQYEGGASQSRQVILGWGQGFDASFGSTVPGWQANNSDSAGIAAKFAAGDSRWGWELNPVLATGHTLTAVDVLLKPFTASASGMSVRLYTGAVDFTTPAAPAPSLLATFGTAGVQLAANNTNVQVVGDSSLSMAAFAKSASRVFIQVRSFAVGDLVYAARLTYSDIGPRGY
jgi:hypothetical protein